MTNGEREQFRPSKTSIWRTQLVGNILLFADIGLEFLVKLHFGLDNGSRTIGEPAGSDKLLDGRGRLVRYEDQVEGWRHFGGRDA